MKVVTQHGLLEINPADVVSIRPASIGSGNIEYCDLAYCLEIEDDSEPYGANTILVSELDAEALSKDSGIEIPVKKVMPKRAKCTIFMPFSELLILDEWERFFYDCVTKAISPEPESNPAPSSFSDDRTLYEENHQPISIIEQVFQAQNNCIQCGKLVFDVSKVCSACIKGHF